MAKNYYEILGVDKKATQDEIKSAYRKLVKQYHPDLHPGDETAAAKFKEINEANETLSDEQKRAAYDYELEHPGMGGAGGFSGGQGFGGFSGFGDIFSEFFSGFGGGSRDAGDTKEKGADVNVEIELSFLDAAKGCKKTISYARKEPCSACKGTGAKNGTAYTVCDKCKGTGSIQYVSGSSIFRTVQVRACDACGGTGKKITEKCTVCGGKGYNRGTTELSFDIPAGCDSNSYLRKRGFGHASTNGGEPGDLIVTFKILPHKIFTRQNFDLYVDLPIPFTTCMLGGKVKVPTLDDGCVDMDIPAGTVSGKKFVMRGKGIRTARSGTGNLYVTVIAEMPASLSKDQKQALAAFADTIELKQLSKSKDYADKMDALFGVKPYNNK